MYKQPIWETPRCYRTDHSGFGGEASSGGGGASDISTSSCTKLRTGGLQGEGLSLLTASRRMTSRTRESASSALTECPRSPCPPPAYPSRALSLLRFLPLLRTLVLQRFLPLPLLPDPAASGDIPTLYPSSKLSSVCGAEDWTGMDALLSSSSSRAHGAISGVATYSEFVLGARALGRWSVRLLRSSIHERVVLLLEVDLRLDERTWGERSAAAGGSASVGTAASCTAAAAGGGTTT
ncbi:hypothetical protein C8R44DRAFT_875378 [Mycena epipterygia]|nr:hypothetical protein C8R44DRAFT_875378 [Mycena epipterygia]